MSGSNSWPTTSVTLVGGMKNGNNHEAWQSFQDIYRPLLLGFCRRRLAQEADAEDVTQEIFKTVACKIGKFEYDPRRGKFRGWLGKLARNAIYRKRKEPGYIHRANFEDCELNNIDGESDAEWVDSFNRHVLITAIERSRGDFSPDKWQAFEQVWMRDQKPAFVAKAMGKPASWVSQAKYDVLQRLKAEVIYLAADEAILSRPPLGPSP